MRLFLLACAALLFALPAFAQTTPVPDTQDWAGMAASLQTQLMEAMSSRMQHDAQILRQLQVANAKAVATEAKVAELEKRLATVPSVVGPQK